MIATSIQITSVNMRRHNLMFFAFLQDTHADYDVQEPWFGHINTLRSDTDPDVVEVLGLANHAGWDFLLPKHSGSDVYSKVACYVRRSFLLWTSAFPHRAYRASTSVVRLFFTFLFSPEGEL